jgi:hypothetical protein
VQAPQFRYKRQVRYSVFREKFDFFLAYSIWTHAAKPQIMLMLDSFLRDSRESGIFLTTFLPAGWLHRDYRGEAWFGTSHQSDAPGCIHHSFGWIKRECEGRGLVANWFGRDITHGQYWLRIAKGLNPTPGQARNRQVTTASVAR